VSVRITKFTSLLLSVPVGFWMIWNMDSPAGREEKEGEGESEDYNESEDYDDSEDVQCDVTCFEGSISDHLNNTCVDSTHRHRERTQTERVKR
jgi:hypothetical protein